MKEQLGPCKESIFIIDRQFLGYSSTYVFVLGLILVNDSKIADISKISNFETLSTNSIAKKVITALSILAVAPISKLFPSASKYFDVMKI